MDLAREVSVYSVITHKGLTSSESLANKQYVKNILISPSTSSSYYPTRSVQLYHDSEIDIRTATYILSSSEVNNLEQSPYVKEVELHVSSPFTTQSAETEGAWCMLGRPITATNIETYWGEDIRDPDPDIYRQNFDNWLTTNFPYFGKYINPTKHSILRRNWGEAKKGTLTWWAPPSDYRSHSPGSSSFSQSIDGTGVDIIVCDIGSPQHYDPSHYTNQFTELRKNGGSGDIKLNTIDWNETLSITSASSGFKTTAAYYSRTSHGNVMGVMSVGNGMGIAPGAELYFLLVNPASDPNTVDDPYSAGTGLGQALNLARLFHESKSIDPTLGAKRPTVFALSLASQQRRNAAQDLSGSTEYNGQPISPLRTNVDSQSFNGIVTTWADVCPPDLPLDEPNLAITGSGSTSAGYSSLNMPYRQAALDAQAEAFEDAGGILVKATGNTSQVVFGSGSEDDPTFSSEWSSSHYNDWWSFSKDITSGDLRPGANENWKQKYGNVLIPSGTKFYPNRGNSPITHKTIEVSGINPINAYPIVENDNNGDFAYNIQFQRGPRIDVFCPTLGFTTPDVNDYARCQFETEFVTPHPTYKRTVAFEGVGTSYACPAVAGLIALYLQTRPTADGIEVRKWLHSNASPLGGDIRAERYTSASQTNVPGTDFNYWFARRGPNADPFNGYEDGNPVCGGKRNRVAFNPFNSAKPLESTGSFNIEGGLQLKL